MAQHHQPFSEQKIAHALAPVAAPDELWARVSEALPPAAGTVTTGRRSSGRWGQHIAIAGALAAALTAGVIYLRAYDRPASLVDTAIQLHRSGATVTDPHYAVQRYPGLPATLVSLEGEAVPPPTPGNRKEVHTRQAGDLTVSEWTLQGRQWVLVSHKSAHQAACRICHKA